MGRKSNENFENERKGAETKCRKDQESLVTSKNTHVLLCRVQIHGNYIIFKERGKGYFESDNNDLVEISIRFKNKGVEWSIENDAFRKISAQS